MSLWDESGYGRNIDSENHDRVRCARCGFPCVLSRDSHANPGSRLGWGLRYVREYLETTIASATVIDVPDAGVTPGAIITEDGLEIITEDGQTIIPEG